ncbi:vWA domain-containing protein [Virgisporangium aurantiacum]|uniref:vWA domain-containing protein n=1 Tax=Virgisporangium aurantiacum TaxID=175570 RepID=UPI0019528E67|nr:VWA domain-containing protein [Virgisporangium aurantiacum]
MTPTALTSGATVPVPDATIRVEVRWDPAGPTVDLTGLLLGADGRVGGDGDMVFYNHPRHASGAVRLHTGAGRLEVALPSVPAEVATVALAVSVDSGTFDAVTGLHLLVREVGNEPVLRFDPPELAGLSALVLGELYRRGAGWKFRAVGQGWSDGLAGLARTYGIAVEADADGAPSVVPGVAAPAVAVVATPGEERLPADVRDRLSLRKRLVGEVLAKQDAAGVRARVFLVLDASGSLEHAYHDGTVARVVERLAAVGAQLTPDGVLAAWIFASTMTRLPDLTVADLPEWTRRYVRPGRIQDFAADPVPMFRPDGTLDGEALGYGNEEPKVMKDVVRTVAALPPGPPVLVLFLSDGGVSRSQQIESILRKSADRPMFWQFVGVDGANYGVLERLDALTGRRVDNAGFFAVDDIDTLTDADLYARLLSEFPTWIRAARSVGVIR